VVDASGALVGLIFDGNITSLANRYVYADATQRAVSVDSAAILEGLRKVYGEEALAKELTGGAAVAPAGTAGTR
jgi:Peptidase S46